jgi:hypothetical protein
MEEIAVLGPLRQSQMTKTFFGSLIFMNFLFIGLFFGFVRYTPYDSHPDEQVTKYYQIVSQKKAIFFFSSHYIKLKTQLL